MATLAAGAVLVGGGLVGAPAAEAAETAAYITRAQADAVAPLCPEAWKITPNEPRLVLNGLSRDVAVATCIQVFRSVTRLEEGSTTPPAVGTPVPPLPGGTAPPELLVVVVDPPAARPTTTTPRPSSTPPSTSATPEPSYPPFLLVPVPVQVPGPAPVEVTITGPSASASASADMTGGGGMTGGGTTGGGASPIGGSTSGGPAGVTSDPIVGPGLAESSGAAAPLDPLLEGPPPGEAVPAGVAPGPAAGVPVGVLGRPGTVSDPATATATVADAANVDEDGLSAATVVGVLAAAVIIALLGREMMVHGTTRTRRLTAAVSSAGSRFGRRRAPHAEAEADTVLTPGGFVQRWLDWDEQRIPTNASGPGTSGSGTAEPGTARATD